MAEENKTNAEASADQAETAADTQPDVEEADRLQAEAAADLADAEADTVAGAAEPDVEVEAAEDPAAVEIAALKDQVLRAKAETENIRRRSARELENAHKYAVEKFAGELLPVLDSLSKAAEVASSSEGEEAAGAMAEGVSLCLKLFEGAFEKSGVQTVDPLGEPFDPTCHEAMAMVDNPDAEPNSVMDVMQKGYVLNGRVLRAAKVIVVKPPAVDTSA